MSLRANLIIQWDLNGILDEFATTKQLLYTTNSFHSQSQRTPRVFVLCWRISKATVFAMNCAITTTCQSFVQKLLITSPRIAWHRFTFSYTEYPAKYYRMPQILQNVHEVTKSDGCALCRNALFQYIPANSQKFPDSIEGMSIDKTLFNSVI